MSIAPESGISKDLLHFFGMEPTRDQAKVIGQLDTFLSADADFSCFVLSGYAGTGKTSLMASLVKSLVKNRIKVRMMAPTGRAAKVLGFKAERMATTIHKVIYRRGLASDGNYRVTKMPNLAKNTVFIVDEASMIGDYTMQNDGTVNQMNLLEDLMEFVFSGKGCKLILLGDEGQLPPVGSDYSPALHADYLKNTFFNLNLTTGRLTEVVRQQNQSSILVNATKLRSAEEFAYPKFELVKKGDLIRLSGEDTQDRLEQSYQEVGLDETIVITRSNKRANLFNQHIRGRIHWYEDELNNGDLLMAVKNNYFWLEETSPMGFIANGEMFKIKRVLSREEKYGFHFATVIVEFVDYPDESERELIVLMDTLSVEGPSLGREEMKRLFFEIEKDYIDIKAKKKRYDKIVKDPYFNALQVKYAYAVTCHKSQGGQWAHVYIDQGYLVDEMLDASYFRWLYTALTRATEKVYLLNFKPEFFD